LWLLSLIYSHGLFARYQLISDGIRESGEFNSVKMPKEISLTALGKKLNSIKANKETSLQILYSLMLLKKLCYSKQLPDV